MGNLVVTSTQRGEGKTSVAAALASRALDAGRSAAAIKPLCEADDIEPRGDGSIFGRLIGTVDAGPSLVPSGEGLTDSELDHVARSVGSLEADAVAVEVDSSLDPADSVRVVAALSASVLLVVRHQWGMTADDVLARTGHYGDHLAGVLLNCRGPYLGSEVSALAGELESAGVRIFGAVPDDRRLLGATVAQIAEHLGGRFLLRGEDDDPDPDGPDATDAGGRLVEHFLVGGWMMDEGTRYFETRTSKAVVVRGDRPDLQMSALSTPTEVLILTGGIEPIEYVMYEAREERTPVLVVEQDTIEVMEALETLVDTARFDHQGKLARMSELIGVHADGAALDGLI